LLDVYNRLKRSLARFSISAVPIHGDAQAANVFITATGARWTDFGSASLGPREWDLCCMPELPVLEPIDHELRTVLAEVRSFCVSVWCWDLADLPGKREAAKYHLDYLTGRHSRENRAPAQSRSDND